MSLCPCCVPPVRCVVGRVLPFHVSPLSDCRTQFTVPLLLFLPSFPLSCLPSFPRSLLLFSVFFSPSFFPTPPSHFPLPQPAAVPYSPLRCAHLCDRLLLTHSTSAALQMRAGAKGASATQGRENGGLMKPP